MTEYIIVVGQAMSSVIKTVPATLDTYAIYLHHGYAMLSLCSLIKINNERDKLSYDIS